MQSVAQHLRTPTDWFLTMLSRSLGFAWLVALNLFALWQLAQDSGTPGAGGQNMVEAVGLALLIGLDLFIVWRILRDDE